MAFLSRIFRRDPRQILQKAEGWLAEGKGVRALHAAEDLARSAEGRVQEEAEDLARRAHVTIMNRALEEAKVSKEAGDLEEAADWLGTALDHCDDEGQRAEIQGLQAALADRARQAQAAALEMDPTDEAPMADGEMEYEMLMGIFTPETVELYNGRPAPLRQAVVAFHNGNPGEALGILEELLEESPNDPVFRLEAGQCRLVLGQVAAAQEDFEAIGDAFGDDCLDVSERVSVPILLATAMLDGGRAGDLLERFEGQVDLEEAPQALAVLWARALAEVDRDEEALEAYLTLGNRFPADPELALEAALVLQNQGYEDEAIARLERVVAPCCSTGNCNKPALFLPAARQLVTLYLEEGRNPQRAGEVLAWMMVASRGKPNEEDALLVERYQSFLGEDELSEATDFVAGAGPEPVRRLEG